MEETNYEENVTNKVDPKKVKHMLYHIYTIERDNSKTQTRTDKKMKEEIQKIIMEEADKCF